MGKGWKKLIKLRIFLKLCHLLNRKGSNYLKLDFNLDILGLVSF